MEATNYVPRASKVLYGLSGAGEMYRPLAYRVLYGWEDTVADAKYWSKKLRLEKPGIKEVYLIDNSASLRHAYTDAWRKNTIDSYYLLKDMLQTEGIRIY